MGGGSADADLVQLAGAAAKFFDLDTTRRRGYRRRGLGRVALGRHK